jgi:hypothetical protein
MKSMVALVAAAVAATSLAVTTLPRPPFPGPVRSAPAAKRLVVVSSRHISPGLGGRTPTCHELGLPDSVRGLERQRTICPGGPGFAVYGKDGASARILVSTQGYAFDFKHYVWPPRIRPGEREFVYEEVEWAREAGGLLYVENTHLTYATSSYGQNAYITAIDVKTGRRAWRSPALVANAGTFLVTPKYLVTGYGFTAEDDWLYLLDRKTGRVVERLALPSGPERLTKSGPHIVVRTYDHVLVVDLRNP